MVCFHFQNVRSEDKTIQFNALLTLNHVIKNLVSLRLAVDRRVYNEVIFLCCISGHVYSMILFDCNVSYQFVIVLSLLTWLLVDQSHMIYITSKRKI